MNHIGQPVRQLRLATGFSLRDLAPQGGVFSYLSQVENGRLEFGGYPFETLLHRLAAAFDSHEDELMFLAEKVPDRIRRRVVQ